MLKNLFRSKKYIYHIYFEYSSGSFSPSKMDLVVSTPTKLNSVESVNFMRNYLKDRAEEKLSFLTVDKLTIKQITRLK